MTDHDEPSVEDLRDRQARQEQAAREERAGADTEGEARQGDRRAEKARYLREKLEEQERANRAGTDEG